MTGFARRGARRGVDPGLQRRPGGPEPTAREVIVGQRGYSFAVDLQRLWIRKHRRVDWVKEDLTPVAAEWERAAKAEFDARIMAEPAASRRRGTGSASYSVPELTRLYDFPPDLDGTGQCVGIIELGGGYQEADIEAYMRSVGLRVPKITSVSVGGAVNPPGSAADGVVVLISRWSRPPRPAPTSWSTSRRRPTEGSPTPSTRRRRTMSTIPRRRASPGALPRAADYATVTAIDRALANAAARGITVCCAAGDNGPTDGVPRRDRMRLPRQQPLCAGLRRHAHLGTGGRIARQVAWSYLAAQTVATGGGFSRRFAAPPWQEGGPAATSSAPEAAPGRGLPDVAANASVHSGYRIILNGQSIVIGGTSAVVGLWAVRNCADQPGLGERVGDPSTRCSTRQPRSRGRAARRHRGLHHVWRWHPRPRLRRAPGLGCVHRLGVAQRQAPAGGAQAAGADHPAAAR